MRLKQKNLASREVFLSAIRLDVEQEVLPYKGHFYWKVNA